jgi:hypothetical protein
LISVTRPLRQRGDKAAGERVPNVNVEVLTPPTTGSA